MTIGKAAYRLESLACAPEIGSAAFRLSGPRGQVYDLVQAPTGPECDCWDFLVRRDGIDPRGCKHVRALVGRGLLVAAAMRPGS